MAYTIYPAGAVIADDVAAPYPFVVTSKVAALAALVDLREVYPDLSPVIWGERVEAKDRFWHFNRSNRLDVEASLEAARRSTAKSLLEERIAEGRAFLRKLFPELPSGWSPKPPRGPWPWPWSKRAKPLMTPLSLAENDGGFDDEDLETEALEGRGERSDELLIGLLPTPRSWEAPAYHKFGLFNDCPHPALHVACGRDWAERYGARLVVNTGDMLEYEIARPIGNRREAIEMAREHYYYCSDIVAQDCGTIDVLAARLLGGRYWHFWWD